MSEVQIFQAINEIEIQGYGKEVQIGEEGTNRVEEGDIRMSLFLPFVSACGLFREGESHLENDNRDGSLVFFRKQTFIQVEDD